MRYSSKPMMAKGGEGRGARDKFCIIDLDSHIFFPVPRDEAK